MPDVLQRGEEGRPAGRGGRVAGALVVALLAGAAVWQVASGSSGGLAPDAAHRPDTPAPVTVLPASPSPTTTAPVVAVPTVTSRPPRRLPWSRLPTGPPLSADAAAGRYVVVGGRTRDLGEGVRVATMDRAADGPVLLVQEPDAVSLEQLRPGGVRLVLEEFPGERRLPQGIAVDPTGRFVAYGLASVVPGSNSLVVRDLRTGAATVRLRTKLPFSVADWTSAGVVLQAALDPGGPPYLWRPGPGRPRHIVGFAHGSSGPFLLASAPTEGRWLVTGSKAGCADLVVGVSSRPVRSVCGVALDRRATWASQGGDLVAANDDASGLVVLDVRAGRTMVLHSPARTIVEQVQWSGPRTVLAVVLDRAAEHHAVLRCSLGGRCERVPLPKGFSSEDVVLAR